MNGLNRNIIASPAGPKNDRVWIMISDALGDSKSLELTPKAAHDLAIQILEAAFEAQGLKDFRVVIGVAYEP
jgi:hypothetical protein